MAKQLAPHLALGKQGEQLAEQFLVKAGMHIVARNWRPQGAQAGLELDIVARHKKEIVFIEVKTRTHQRLKGEPYTAFTPQKQAKLTKAAQLFLAQQSLWDAPCRFDLISIVAMADGTFSVEHFINVIEFGHFMDSSNTSWQPW